jgi:hypothetical protein
MTIELFVCWITGIFVGLALATAIITVKSSFATFRVDISNPEKDMYRLDIHGDLAVVPNKKYIMARVDKNANLSQD